MWAATLSVGLFLQSSHSYHGFTVNPERWERCVRDSQRGERIFHNWNHVQKQARGEPRKNKTDQTTKSFRDLPRSWQRELNCNQRFLVATSVTALQHDKSGALTLDTSIKELQAGDIPLPPLLIKASWCPNQSRIGPTCHLHQSAPLCQRRINNALVLALRTNAAWKDKQCLNSQEQKPHVDIHLHILTLTRGLNIDRGVISQRALKGNVNA